MAVLATAKGESCIVENIFEDRFKMVSQLQKMGAQIEVSQNKARIQGTELTGAKVKARELRGGAALVLGDWQPGEKLMWRTGILLTVDMTLLCRDLSYMGARILKD